MNRLCYVVPSLDRGGAERQLLLMMRGLARHMELTLVCVRGAGVLAGEARRAGARLHVLGVQSPWNPQFGWRLSRLFRQHRPDIVHSVMFGFDYQVNRVARRAGVPVIVSSRRQLATWRRPRHIWLQRAANRYADAIVANCEAAARFAKDQERADPSLFHVIYNGIDLRRFENAPARAERRMELGLPAGVPIVGMAANFSPVKDHPLFVRMASELMHMQSDVHFLLLGAGRGERELRNMIARLNLEPHFSIRAPDEVVPHLQAMDVCVLTSRVEGFPNALMESMAAGTPVVASAVGGITELIEDGERGILVENRDPEHFARAVHRLLAHRDEAEAMAQQAREYVRAHLDAPIMVSAYRELYAQLLLGAMRKAG